MKRLFLTLFIGSVFLIFESGCSHTANSAKRKPLFPKKEEGGQAHQKFKTISASNRFSSSKRRNVAGGLLGIHLKKENSTSSYNSRYASTNGSSTFSKRFGRIVPNKFLFIKLFNGKENNSSSYNSRYSSTYSSSSYNKRFGRIMPRKFLFIRLFSGESESTTSFGSRWHGSSSSSYYNSKKRMMKERKPLVSLFINPNRSNDSYSTSYVGLKSSYSYNKKFKRVGRKKFLFLFTINKREAETSTFKGGEINRAFRFNVFSKKDKQVKHRYFFFNRKEHTKKHKKPQMDLFPRNERPF